MFWKPRPKDRPDLPVIESHADDNPAVSALTSAPDAVVDKDPTGGDTTARPGASGTTLARPGIETVAEREVTLRSLMELSNDLNARMDLYEIADVALFNLMGHFGCSRAAIWYVAADGFTGAVLLRGHGVPDPVARAVGSLWTRWLGTSGILEPMLIDDLREIGSVPGIDLAEEAGIALFAPLTARRKLLGLVALGHRVSGRRFSHRDLEALSASLNFVGAALENAAFTNRMVESNRQLQLVNDRLRELDGLKSEFLRNLNHELRTPLTVMSAYVDSLLMTANENPTQHEHLKAVRSEASKLEAMLMRLLDLGKLMGNDLEIEVGRGDLVNLLRTYCGGRRPGVATGLRELRFSNDADVPPAMFERARVIQIVDCLVDNAVKFCPPGSRILVRVERDEDRVRIDVRDDGPGISPERLPHIWESFRQGDGTETREHGGMGVGLSLARELAVRMGGTLDVETEVGHGTVFSLHLPTG